MHLTDHRDKIKDLRYTIFIACQWFSKYRRQIIPGQIDRQGEEEGRGDDTECEEAAGDYEIGEGIERGQDTERCGIRG